MVAHQRHQANALPFKLEGDTPTMRLFTLLEAISVKDSFFTLQSLVRETGLPKPTLHRMLQLLEEVGVLQRQGDGRHYTTGPRLRRLAEKVLMNSTLHGARNSVLRELVNVVGESCNITAFCGSDVVYLDRVETDAPLRFFLHQGSRVPAHCSSSGKLFLSQMTLAQRKRLLCLAPLAKFTDKTKTNPDELFAEFEQIAKDGYAIDDEEYLPGLFCIAVLVPVPSGRSTLGVAMQAPVTRLSREGVDAVLPALRRAAHALSVIESQEISIDDALA